ncbi:MAG: kynureninase [Burkholderiales bacterium]|nr:MAG: kynureninase [Burkholderiales bacterium]
MPTPTTREDCAALDVADPLAFARERFELPPGVIYLDGNSLGAMPRAVAPRMRQAVEHEWAHGLIRSWNDAGWYTAPQRAAAKIARLIGAAPDEVIVTDSISVNLFKLMAGAIGIQRRRAPERTVIVAERGNFPTDVYVDAALARLLGMELVCVEQAEVPAAIERAGDRLAVVQLTQVNYRSGRTYDLPAITARTHALGGLVIWDLAHSAGALPVGLSDAHADFAVGCGYKYLNGGPGAPAFAFVARRWIAELEQPLVGWHGHAAPFGFEHEFRPAPGIERLLCGTEPQLSLIALEAALDAFDGVELAALRAKSVAMTEAFTALAERAVGGFDGASGFGLASPRDPAQRGSQVSLTHPQGYAIVQALIARGVIGDFRAPDILRFGFAPLYLRFVDVHDAAQALHEVVAQRLWDRPEFLARKAVT